MAHYDCSCCGERGGVSHEYCPECKEGRCSRSTPPQNDEAQRNALIAANRGPVWPSACGLVVEVVPTGTWILSPDERTQMLVDDTHAVLKGSAIFVTQTHWDTLMSQVEVRRFE